MASPCQSLPRSTFCAGAGGALSAKLPCAPSRALVSRPLIVLCSGKTPSIEVHRKQQAAAAAAALVQATPPSALRPGNVMLVSTLEDYTRELKASQELNRLLVVEFTSRSLPNAEKTLKSLVELTGATPDVTILRVFADASPELRALCTEHEVTHIPSYVFKRNGHTVHVATGMQAERMREQVLYYGKAEYPVKQLETVSDLEGLLQAHSESERLVVVQVTLNFCGPCARVYPAVLQMSHKMAGEVVFARLFGDANDDTRQLLTNLGIVEVPTFLFYRGNKLLGRYIGSAKGDLVGEVLRYQGVECT